MISKNLLLAVDAGLGAGETAIFPISIFKVKEGINYNTEDPNYDLFKLSMRVSAKRLFPTYEFLDAPFNKPYYKVGDIRTELATMGCVDGKNKVKVNVNKLGVQECDFETLWSLASAFGAVKTSGLSEYIEVSSMEIQDFTSNTSWTKCKKIIRNPDRGDWYYVTVGGRTLSFTSDHPLHEKEKGRTYIKDLKVGDKVEVITTYTESFDDIWDDGEFVSIAATHTELDYSTIEKIEFVGNRGRFSYDVETESDRFDLFFGEYFAGDSYSSNISGFASHNCRTRVIGNVYDPTREVVTGRGNASFTSINLPRLGIESHGDIDLFFEMLEDRMYLVKRQITKRFKLQGTKKVKNYPFLMGQGIWLDSDKLGPEDTIEEIICHASLSIGFIGLAECLTALIGKHHGQSKEAQELGLKIIGRMRELADLWQKEDYELSTGKKVHLNWSILATPAEGLSGTFVRKDKKKYGKIKGVTDKDYYTNSVHIPVGFKIGFAKKIKLEAPYHALCNAGHIMYCEFDGDATQNLEAFESIIRCMKENGVGYGAINVPVDRDPVCGYTGIIGDVCPKCGRNVTESISQDEINEIRRKFGMPCSYNLSSSCCN